MTELKPCPFCGGKGKISFKDYRFMGCDYKGYKTIRYRVQVICNKCKSRGKPIITEPLFRPDPYITKWWKGSAYNDKSYICRKETEKFEPYVNMAIEAWNRREQ